MFGLTNKNKGPKQNTQKKSRRKQEPALRRSTISAGIDQERTAGQNPADRVHNKQGTLAVTKVGGTEPGPGRKPIRKGKTGKRTRLQGGAKSSHQLAGNMRQAMVKVTQLRRAERRKQETHPIAKTTPTMTLKRIVSPQRMESILSRFSNGLVYDLGIDLGTANVLMYAKGKGLVLDEPSCVARDVRSGEILAVGEAARSMLGRTPVGVEVVRPVQAGVIADYDTTEFMLKYFIRTVVPASRLMKTRIVVCVPSGITPVEKRAILEALLRSGAKKTVLMEEPLAAAMGTDLNEAEQVGAMVVDVGGGTTDIAVLCDTGVVLSESLRIGGDSFNDSIVRYIRRKKRLVIGQLTAEEIKIAVGTVDRRAEERGIEVRGRDSGTGLPKTVAVSSLEIQRALESQIMNILEGIKSILEKTPPELVAAISDHGIILTGGGVLIDGFDRVISRSTGIAAYVVGSPRYAVIKGVAKTLDEMASLRDTLEDLE